MTEDEAKTKWCPFARAVRGDGVSGMNRDTELKPDVACFCIASACMAWRWDAKPNPDYKPHMAQTWPGAWPPVPMHVRDPENGHCGLAGGRLWNA